MSLSLNHKILLYYALILGAVLAVLGTTFFLYESRRRIRDIDANLDLIVPHLRGSMLTFDRANRPVPRRGPGGARPGRGPMPGPPGGFPNRDFPTEEQLAMERAGSPLLPGWKRQEDLAPSNMLERKAEKDISIVFETLYVPREFYGAIYRPRETIELRYQSSNFPDIELPIGQYEGNYLRTRDHDFREILMIERDFHYLIGQDVRSLNAGLNVLMLQILAAGLAIYVVCLGAGWYLVARSLTPLGAIQDAAVKIAHGKLDERIPDGNRGKAREFDVLIEKLNSTFAQFEALFGRQVRFTTDASHELKTPLTILVAQVELALRSRRTGEEYQEMFKLCAHSCERLDRIIKELSEIARFDSGRVELEYEELPLDHMLQNLAREMQACVTAQGSTLTTDLQSLTAQFDPFRMDQALTNLINNALQHNARPVRITLRTRQDGDRVRIQVIDNGTGILPKNLKSIFDRFFQEDESRTWKEGRDNTGLGLTISKAIIELHGGTLTVKSTPDVETVFTITIPRLHEIHAASGPGKDPGPWSPAPGGGFLPIPGGEPTRGGIC